MPGANARLLPVIRPYLAADEDAVIALWDQCRLLRPWNDPRKDIARKLAVAPDLFLVAVVDGQPVGTVMAGYDGHRGWVNYLAVDPVHRRRGNGRLLMAGGRATATGVRVPEGEPAGEDRERRGGGILPPARLRGGRRGESGQAARNGCCGRSRCS